MIGKRVFISGGAGVIGSALVRLLYDKGAILWVGDLKQRPSSFPLDIIYRQGDLNYIQTEEFESFRPEVFIHLAATFERSTETYDFWHENFHHNVRLSNHLMSCLKDSSFIKRIVFASSYLIYNPEFYLYKTPQQKAFRLKESDPIYPRNLCGTAKLLHEMELNFLNHFNHSSYSSVSARIFRVYGKNSKDIISRWIRALLNKEELTVYKEEGLFDYIYAEDVAEGLIRLAESDLTGIVNLGRDNARRVTEVLEILKEYFPDLQFNRMESDIDYEASQANMDYYFSKLQWKPFRQLEDTIPDLIAFEKQVISLQGLEESFNVLVTSISRKVPLLESIRKAMLKIGNVGLLFGGDISEDAIGRFFVDRFWIMPKIDELDIQTLIDYCVSHQIKAIIPSRDGELLYFATHRKELAANGIHVHISSTESVEVCLDKLKFYRTLSEWGYPVIETTDDISSAPSSSFVVKERFGAGSNNIGLNLTLQEAEIKSKTLALPVYQPFVNGKEYSVDLFITRKGKAKGCIVRSRDIVTSGESEVTTTVSNAALEEICISVSERLKLYGHVIFQALIDHNNHIHLIECNCRFGGASSISLAAGLDSFYWFLLEAQGVDIDEYLFIRSNKEKTQVRYKTDLII